MAMRRTLSALLVLALSVGTVAAEAAYYAVPFAELTLTEGQLDETPAYTWATFRALSSIILDDEGEAYVDTEGDFVPRWREGATVGTDPRLLAVSVAAARDVTGSMYLPPSGDKEAMRVRFRIPADAASDEHEAVFYLAKERHYDALSRRRIPGAAWFRYQARTARERRIEIGTAEDELRDIAQRRARETDTQQSYALLTGGRAVSENLALDRLLRVEEGGEATLDVTTLPGITVQEMDWAPLIEGLNPEPDPLASIIPADQHALFFSSFTDFLTMMDEARENGTPVLRLMDTRSEDARTHERYERQLCLKADALSRLLGPSVVKSVAITGGDPYMRTGTDVAILFEAVDAAMLRPMIDARVASGTQGVPGVQAVQGDVGGVPYSGARTPDRRVSSYVATLGKAVVVTNSLAQLERIAAAWKGETPAMQTLPEYTFFRDRYGRGDAGETALLVIPDAAIRRWCGPQWRIAASRRTRAAAVMADVQARYMADLVKGAVKLGPIDEQLPLPDAGTLSMTQTGVRSSVYGDLEFLTPIAELAPTMVTDAEARGYNDWRRRYQRNWRQFFDPIAVRFGVKADGLSADLTVMPLIGSSEYRDLIAVASGAAIEPDAGDPHDSALIHYALAVNTDSGPMREFSSFARGMAASLQAQPLSWLGGSIAVYVDESPFWAEMAEAPEMDDFMDDNFHRLPVALHAEVGNGLKCAVFLAAVRGFIETSAPGMTVWEALSYNDQPYVRVSPSEQVRSSSGRMQEFAVYYSASGDGLVLTLSEEMLKAALDRRATRRKAAAEGKTLARPGQPWLGESMCLQAMRGALDIIRDLADDQYQKTMRRRAHDNIPILNEWKRLFPDRDPVDVHEQVWQTRLVCPGGGSYVWDEDWQTMTSTAYGRPGAPKDGPAWPQAVRRLLSGNLGVTFEHQGLRARADLAREVEER